MSYVLRNAVYVVERYFETQTSIFRSAWHHWYLYDITMVKWWLVDQEWSETCSVTQNYKRIRFVSIFKSKIGVILVCYVSEFLRILSSRKYNFLVFQKGQELIWHTHQKQPAWCGRVKKIALIKKRLLLQVDLNSCTKHNHCAYIRATRPFFFLQLILCMRPRFPKKPQIGRSPLKVQSTSKGYENHFFLFLRQNKVTAVQQCSNTNKIGYVLIEKVFP